MIEEETRTEMLGGPTVKLIIFDFEHRSLWILSTVVETSTVLLAGETKHVRCTMHITSMESNEY